MNTYVCVWICVCGFQWKMHFQDRPTSLVYKENGEKRIVMESEEKADDARASFSSV